VFGAIGQISYEIDVVLHPFTSDGTRHACHVFVQTLCQRQATTLNIVTDEVYVSTLSCSTKSGFDVTV
jgi:hypothetical protein